MIEIKLDLKKYNLLNNIVILGVNYFEETYV
jgi:hypothetical protein